MTIAPMTAEMVAEAATIMKIGRGRTGKGLRLDYWLVYMYLLLLRFSQASLNYLKTMRVIDGKTMNCGCFGRMGVNGKGDVGPRGIV